jgi:hypothetical protein
MYAFHVFKVCVANLNKPQEVLRILADNKVKLIKCLSGCHKEKEDVDGQFRDKNAGYFNIATIRITHFDSLFEEKLGM